MTFLDRIIDRANLYFYNSKRSVSIFSRTIALVALASMLTSVFPTLAEESDPVQQEIETVEPPQEEPAPAPTEMANVEEPEPSTTESNPESLAPETTDEEATEEEEQEEEKVEISEIQPRITFRFPNSVAHDPRASIAFLPQLLFSGGGVGMMCISFNGAIDIGVKNFVDSYSEGALLASGDLTSNLRITGDLGQISQFINSGGGLKLISPNRRLNWTSVSFGYVELNGIEDNPEFCGGVSSRKSIGFRALGLQMENVKTKVDFNKPKG